MQGFEQHQSNCPASQLGDCDLYQLLDTLPMAAYLCDAEGLITYFNRRAELLWGRAPRLNSPVDRFCGSFKLFSPDGMPIAHHRCWMALALQNDREYSGQEILIERPDGSRIASLAHASPIRDSAGRLVGAVNVLVDISERAVAEEQLRQSDRRKSEFLAVLAHELRNPLAPLRNGLHILRRAGEDPDLLEEACGMMERQLAQMVRLIDDLQDVSRISRGKVELRRERIELAGPIQDAIESSRPLIEDGTRVLTVDLPDTPIPVDADRMRLSQVFANLLRNAAEYTAPGGHIRLSLERHGSDAVVQIQDDGIGIPPEALPGIFGMFTQAEGRRGGSGIGLSLARELVHLHGGSIEAYSTGRDQGSQFVVRLPVVLADPSADGSQRAGEERRSKQRILVVDDNRDVAVSLSLMLQVQGHETQTAHDGLQALAVAESFRPSVVLLDIGLPKLNGFETCRCIRQQAWGEDMVLIALTGWGQEEDKCRAKEAGFNFHLLKPLDPDALDRLLAGLLLTSS